MEKQKISVMTLALLLFVTVFGISNVPNNYGSLGNNAIGWFIMLAIYFIPLALIIAELASKNADTRSGMSAWIGEGLGERWAFIGAWSYFIANIFYIPMLASRIPVMFSWVFTAEIDSLAQVVDTSGQIPGVINATNNQAMYLLMALIVVALALVLAAMFDKIFSKLGKIVGWLSLFVTAVFIVFALLAIPVNGLEVANPITFANARPVLNKEALSTFAWILFAISGIETIGAYVGLTENAKRKIPKGIIVAAILIIGAYVIGFVSMSFILTPEQIPVDHLENMIQIMYAQVFNLWGFGPWVLRAIMLIYSLITITALVLWLTSTVTVVFENFPEGILSEKVRNAQINGLPLFGLLFTGLMIAIVVIISNAGTSSNIYKTLYNMSTISVIVPYVLIALSYVVYKLKINDAPFKMVKNDKLALGLGVVILLVTIVAIVFSCFDLTIVDSTERLVWLMVSLGGLTFFISIGIAIYYMKVNIDIAFILLTVIFIIAGAIFAKILYLIAVAIFIYYLLKRKTLIERQTRLLHLENSFEE